MAYSSMWDGCLSSLRSLLTVGAWGKEVHHSEAAIICTMFQGAVNAAAEWLGHLDRGRARRKGMYYSSALARLPSSGYRRNVTIAGAMPWKPEAFLSEWWPELQGCASIMMIIVWLQQTSKLAHSKLLRTSMHIQPLALYRHVLNTASPPNPVSLRLLFANHFSTQVTKSGSFPDFTCLEALYRVPRGGCACVLGRWCCVCR